jgi:hypothetical protein
MEFLSGHGDPGRWLIPVYAYRRPKRASEFRVRVKALAEGGPAIPLGALTVANPLPTEFPRWTPQVLPAMMSGAGPSVRLEEIRFKREPVARSRFAASRSNVECRFTIAPSEASGWEPLQLGFGAVRTVASPIRVTGEGMTPRRGPKRGEDNARVLREVAGLGAAEVSDLEAAGVFG